MDTLIRTSQRLVNSIQTDTFRYLYHLINWSDRLIMIKGARGVGKTTLILQHIKEKFGPLGTALYASCDNLWFAENNIIDLVEYHFTHGGTHLFLDEIHRYSRNWQQELKNIYDSYPGYHVVFTGSSITHLDTALVDLSRRCLPYKLFGLSFREYLKFEGIADCPELSINDILNSSHSAEWELVNRIPERILPIFQRYIGKGYYPFYKSISTGEYRGRIERVVNTSIMQDIPSVEKIELETLHKINRLLYVLATDVPFTLNVQSLSQKMGISRNMIIKMFDLLDGAGIIRRITSGWRSPKSVAKPKKILFDNTDIMASLSDLTQVGTMRETFLASMLAPKHKIYEPPTGDFSVDEKYTIEVGGKSKTYRQVADIPDSYIVQADIETGVGNKIPLWLFGFLY